MIDVLVKIEQEYFNANSVRLITVYIIYTIIQMIYCT